MSTLQICAHANVEMVGQLSTQAAGSADADQDGCRWHERAGTAHLALLVGSVLHGKTANPSRVERTLARSTASTALVACALSHELAVERERESETYLADSRVIDASNEAVELVAHSLGGYTGGGGFEVLFWQKASRRSSKAAWTKRRESQTCPQ